jgi:urea carboxylase-associated protein 2
MTIESGTNSTDGARSHARAQADAAGMRIPHLGNGVEPGRLLWAEAVPGNSYTTKVLGRGSRLRLADPDGGACAHLLLFRAEAPWERLNVADTMKVPWQAYLGAGHPLLSDQGRVLATVVADSSGHHDMLCGPTEAGRGLLVLGGIKNGLGARDIAPSVALFSGVRVAATGALEFTGSAGPGTAVDLLIHLPVIVLLVNAAHPLDPAPNVTGLDVLAWQAGDELTTPVNDEPEYLRALFNTEAAWAAAQNWGS